MNKITCTYAKDWTGNQELYKCQGTDYCISQNNYGGTHYCSAMLKVNVEARAEKRAKRILDELIDDPRDIQAKDVTFIDEIILIGDDE